MVGTRYSYINMEVRRSTIGTDGGMDGRKKLLLLPAACGRVQH